MPSPLAAEAVSACFLATWCVCMTPFRRFSPPIVLTSTLLLWQTWIAVLGRISALARCVSDELLSTTFAELWCVLVGLFRWLTTRFAHLGLKFVWFAGTLRRLEPALRPLAASQMPSRRRIAFPRVLPHTPSAAVVISAVLHPNYFTDLVANSPSLCTADKQSPLPNLGVVNFARIWAAHRLSDCCRWWRNVQQLLLLV